MFWSLGTKSHEISVSTKLNESATQNCKCHLQITYTYFIHHLIHLIFILSSVNNRPKLEPHLVGQRIKNSPEQFPREMKLFIWCRSKVAPASSQAVILPTTLIVIGQQLGKVYSSTICWLRNIFFKKKKSLANGTCPLSTYFSKSEIRKQQHNTQQKCVCCRW